MAERKLHYRLARLIVLPAIALALLTSGCLWGVVKDADTGAGLPGMTVTYTDVNGATGTATTDANGIYSFDQAAGPYPAMGPVSFEVSGPGYEPMTAARLAEYNDNRTATFSNLSTFWEAQSFNLTQHLVQRVQFSVTSVDVDVAELAPAGLAYQRRIFRRPPPVRPRRSVDGSLRRRLPHDSHRVRAIRRRKR